MRIISNFKDYYDFLAEHDKDHRTHIYHRIEEKIIHPSFPVKFTEYQRNLLNMATDFHSNNSSHLKTLVISGKCYPICLDPKKSYSCYNFENLTPYTLNSLPPEFKNIKIRNWHLGAKTLSKLMEEISEINNAMWLNEALECPVLLLDHCYGRVEKPLGSAMDGYYFSEYYHVTLNPNSLLKYGLSKILDSYQCYQEIDYFISNIMVSDEGGTSTMTDKEKAEAHGFNEQSFRNVRPHKRGRK